MVRMGGWVRVNAWGRMDDTQRVDGGWEGKDGWCVRFEGLKGFLSFFLPFCEVAHGVCCWKDGVWVMLVLVWRNGVG